MFDCVLLAAGASSRMRSGQVSGSKGRFFKPLLDFSGQSLLEASLSPALEAGCRVLLVLGCEAESIQARLRASSLEACQNPERVLPIINESWQKGMLGSIQAALPFVKTEAFFIAHADMPFILPEDYLALASSYSSLPSVKTDSLFNYSSREIPVQSSVVAVHKGSWGHPVLLPSTWIGEISALMPAERIRPFLLQKPLKLLERGEGVRLDIDTPEDYQSSLQKTAGKPPRLTTL